MKWPGVFVVKFIARLSTINWTIYYLPVDFQVCHFLIYDVLTAAAVAAPGGNIDFHLKV